MNATQRRRLDRLAAPEAARLARRVMLAVARARCRLTLRELLHLHDPPATLVRKVELLEIEYGIPALEARLRAFYKDAAAAEAAVWAVRDAAAAAVRYTDEAEACLLAGDYEAAGRLWALLSDDELQQVTAARTAAAQAALLLDLAGKYGIDPDATGSVPAALTPQ